MINFSEIGMVLCLFGSAIASLVDTQILIIGLTFIFVFMFNNGIGPILWIYSSEILDDYGCSITGVINMLFTWIFGTFSNLGKY